MPAIIPGAKHGALPVRSRRKPFVPSVRGDLAQATVSPESFAEVAPAVPRPVSYLLDRRLCAIPRLSARDVALWEWVVTYAIASHPDGLPQQVHEPAIPVRPALVAMSGRGRTVQPRELADSLVRLYGGERQNLAIDGAFRASLPGWVVPLLRQELYGYIELAALARFSTKGAALLYRHIVGRLAEARVRYSADMALFAVALTVTELGEVLGMPSPIRMGPLRIRYLRPALSELAEHVTAFEVVNTSEAKDARGRNIGLSLNVRLRPPEMRTAAARLVSKEDLRFLHSYPDEARFQLKFSTLIRLGSAIPTKLMPLPKPGSRRSPTPALASELYNWRRWWLVAIDEALSGAGLTPGYESRVYRGKRLLDAVDRGGADKAFWSFISEEMESPDLREHLDASVDNAPLEILAQAEAARGRRFRAAQAARRRALRQARAEGRAPPASSRKPAEERRSTLAAALTPVPIEPAITALPPVAPEPDAALVELLATAEARAEAWALWWYWQMAVDLPRLHAAETAKRLLKGDLAAKFPIFFKADEAMGGEYRRNLRILLDQFDWLLQSHEAPVGTKVPNFVDTSLAIELTLFLGRSFLTPILRGSSTDPKGILLRHRAYIRARMEERYAKWQAQSASAISQRGVQSTLKAPMDAIRNTPSIVPMRKDTPGRYVPED